MLSRISPRLNHPPLEFAELEKAAEGFSNSDRIITLNFPQENWQIAFFGCHGTGGEDQKEVAHLLEYLHQQNIINAQFIVPLGDNIYTEGANNPTDPLFKKCFDQIYLPSHFVNINKKPYFFVIGNHDKRKSKINLMKENIGLQSEAGGLIGMNQVKHTYLSPHPYDDLSTEKTLDQFTGWQMPGLFYSLILKTLYKREVQFFFLDSNTLVTDFYYACILKSDTTEKNQINWLLKHYRAAEEKNSIILFDKHHPNYNFGRREFNSDAAIYVAKDILAAVKKYFSVKNISLQHESYNHFLKAISEDLKLKPHINFVAHEHFAALYEDKESIQVTLGNGGNKLQKVYNTELLAEAHCLIREHGFALFSYTNQEFELQFFTINKNLRFDTIKNNCPNYHHLKFKINLSFNSIEPTGEIRFEPAEKKIHLERTYKEEDSEKNRTFCQTLKLALTKYFSLYSPSEIKEIACSNTLVKKFRNKKSICLALDLLNYLNQYQADDFDITLATVNNALLKNKIKSQRLKQALNETFEAVYQLSFTNYMRENMKSEEKKDDIEIEIDPLIEETNQLLDEEIKPATLSFFDNYKNKFAICGIITGGVVFGIVIVTIGTVTFHIPLTLASGVGLFSLGSLLGSTSTTALMISVKKIYELMKATPRTQPDTQIKRNSSLDFTEDNQSKEVSSPHHHSNNINSVSSTANHPFVFYKQGRNDSSIFLKETSTIRGPK